MPNVYALGVSEQTKKMFRETFTESADVVIRALVRLCRDNPELCRTYIAGELEAKKKSKERK